VAVRIERIGLLVHISLLAAEADIMDEVAKAMERGCLFVLSITGYQASSTLYILHGQPEGAESACLTIGNKLVKCNLKENMRV